jgi:hypothetical protein
MPATIDERCRHDKPEPARAQWRDLASQVGAELTFIVVERVASCGAGVTSRHALTSG